MSAKVDISVVGVKDTINKLRKLDPELQKQFKVDATAIAQPAINAAKAMYTRVPLSGMSRDYPFCKLPALPPPAFTSAPSA